MLELVHPCRLLFLLGVQRSKLRLQGLNTGGKFLKIRRFGISLRLCLGVCLSEELALELDSLQLRLDRLTMFMFSLEFCKAL